MKLVVALGLLAALLFALPLMFERVSDLPTHIDVRIVDSYTVEIQRESYPEADYLNALVLAIGCGMAALAALLIWTGVLAGAVELGGFFVLTTILLALLAIEETFEVSETVAANVGVNPNRTDLVLPLVAAAYLVLFRRIVMRSSRAVWVGGGGAALFAAAVLIDEFPGGGRVEDPLESVASLVLMAAFGLLTVDLLRRDGRPAEAVA